MCIRDRDIGIQAQNLKNNLLFLIDEDTNAFNGILSAMRISSSSDEEKKIRQESILNANRYAIDIPITLSFPRASTAIVAVRLESIPPDNPIATLLKLFFLT